MPDKRLTKRCRPHYKLIFVVAFLLCGCAWRSLVKDTATIAIPTASAIAFGVEAHDCRQRTGVENCAGGYGPAKARIGIDIGTSAGLGILSVVARHKHLQEWSAFSVGPTAANIYWAKQQSEVPANKKDDKH